MADPKAPTKGVSQILAEVLKDLEVKLGQLDKDLKSAQEELQTERSARKKLASTTGDLADLGSASDELEEEIQKRRKLEEALEISQKSLKQAQSGSGSETLLKEIDELKTTLEKAKISINAHGVNGFGTDHKQNRNFFEFARRAGIRNLTANPQPDSFDSLEKLVAEFNVRICIHNHGPGALYDGLETVTSAVEGRHRLIGACVDTGHVLRSGEDPVKWVRELGPRVFAVHLKDVAEQKKRTHDVVIGTGHLDVVGLFTALREVRFPADGSMSMEYESNPDNPIDDIRQCLEVASRAIAQVRA